MAGGPINGAPWSAAAGLIPGLGTAVASGVSRVEQKSITGIIVPTVIQMAADVLKYWTSMTCLYDRYWTADPDKVTLPICMFHVKKIVPTYTNEVSKKRVILYEPQQDEELFVRDAADQMRRGIMQTIVDNVVKQPTTYNAEIIVPFQPTGRYVAQGAKMVSDIVMAFSDLFGGDNLGGFGDWWEGIFATVFAAVKTAKQASEIAGLLPNMDGVSYINVNSLEAMASSGRTLCMKMWTGYDYKFVTVLGCTPDKQGAEDDVFRATLSLQEMPVLVVTKPREPQVQVINRNWAVTAVSAVHGALVAPLIAMTGVKQAAGSNMTTRNMISTMLGG